MSIRSGRSRHRDGHDSSGAAELAIAGELMLQSPSMGLQVLIASGLTASRNGEPERAAGHSTSHGSRAFYPKARQCLCSRISNGRKQEEHDFIEMSGYGAQRDLDPDKPASGLRESMEIALSQREVYKG